MNQIALFEGKLEETPIVELNGDYGENSFYIKRDDLLPFSFGGNKVRKAAEFYKEIKNVNADMVVTYGSNSSNHCRIIANMASAMGIKCHIISPEEDRTVLYNTAMVQMFGATIETCPINEVAQTIEKCLNRLKKQGFHPYFIMGGGHGTLGTEAYRKAYEEILKYEERNKINLDYIFHASGTGTTQAGLLCGKFLNRDTRTHIVGISIAREEERGRAVVKESILNYLGKEQETKYEDTELIFTDSYRMDGYGKYNHELPKFIDEVMKTEGIPMDTTYVGKAFYGMTHYLKEQNITGKNILFLHTGGTPLYFDGLNKRGIV